jgi:hypothetical protein
MEWARYVAVMETVGSVCYILEGVFTDCIKMFRDEEVEGTVFMSRK